MKDKIKFTEKGVIGGTDSQIFYRFNLSFQTLESAWWHFFISFHYFILDIRHCQGKVSYFVKKNSEGETSLQEFPYQKL